MSLSNGLPKNDKDFHKSLIENEKIVLNAMGFIPLLNLCFLVKMQEAKTFRN